MTVWCAGDPNVEAYEGAPYWGAYDPSNVSQLSGTFVE